MTMTNYEKREKKVQSFDQALSSFFLARGGKERIHLLALWDNWRIVLGPELGVLGVPLGHKGGVLHIGAEDSMALQELSMQSCEILERVNAFMDSEFFESVNVMLLQGKRPLSEKKERRAVSSILTLTPAVPDNLGQLMGRLNPDSPVTRCYETYVKMFQGNTSH